MKWRSLGKIFEAHNQFSWMVSHASVPFAYRLHGDHYKIFFSTRDNENKSHVGYLVIDLKKPSEILELSSQPLLMPGLPGSFDDAGAMLSWIQKTDKHDLVYYIGWNQSSSVPFRNALGLGKLHADHIQKIFEGPILDRSPVDPCLVASAAVIKEADLFRMWYVSGVKWQQYKGELRHYYHIKHATSKDGIDWQRDGIICIDFNADDEYAISRPSVIRDQSGYHMWYSYRGASYQIGYAVSQDGLEWQRKDGDSAIITEDSDWDTEMQAYPHVFQHDNETYMLYNGNGYGKTGFGLAILEEKQ